MNKKVITLAALTLSMSLITGCDKAKEEANNLNNPDPAHEGMDMADEAEVNAVKEIDAAKKNVSEQLNKVKEDAAQKLDNMKDSAAQTITDVKQDATNTVNDVKEGAAEKLNDAKEALNSPDPAHDGMEMADEAELKATKEINDDLEKAAQEFDAEIKKLEE